MSVILNKAKRSEGSRAWPGDSSDFVLRMTGSIERSEFYNVIISVRGAEFKDLIIR